MYEYKCINESCNQIWTIEEGSISSLYLTCPYCKKGRGSYLRQIRNDREISGVNNVVKNTEVKNKEVKEPIKVAAEPRKEEKTLTVKAEKPAKSDKKETKEEKETKKEAVPIKVVVNTTAQTEVEEEDEDIFTRIKRKRQQQEQFEKECQEDENVDTLEMSGGSVEEIEKKIKEFEDFYYIKVLDKNIQQQGKRYNCIVKYCRK